MISKPEIDFSKTKYTKIPTGALRGKDLTFREMGLYAFLSSLPANWTYSPEGVARWTNDSPYAVERALDGLISKGYAVKERVREQGRFAPSAIRLLLPDRCDADSKQSGGTDAAKYSYPADRSRKNDRQKNGDKGYKPSNRYKDLIF